MNRVNVVTQWHRPVRLHRGVDTIRGIQHVPPAMIQLRDFRVLPEQMTLMCDVSWVQKAKKMQYAKLRRPVKAIRPKPAPQGVGTLTALPTHEDLMCIHAFAALGLTLALGRALVDPNPVRTGLGMTSERLFVHLRSAHRRKRTCH